MNYLMNKLFVIYIVAFLSILNVSCGVSNSRVKPAQVVEVKHSSSKAKKDRNIKGSSAVVSLMQKAQNQSSVGNNSAAAATIERALRIEPKNPALWYNLALVKYTAGDCVSAINLAKKSNSFLKNKHELSHKNKQLISECRK